MRHLLACNPFYLLSVVLLLYGCYRVSLEPRLFNHESAHLIFNFSSLQVYELLLVATAIFLAGRRAWYDSAMLVGLEHLLWLVSLILISQAGLIERHALWKWAAVAGVLAAGRLISQKRFLTELNLPRRAAMFGVLVLLVNVALCAVYRQLHESKFGTKLEAGAAYNMNQAVWMFVYPALCALAFALPSARQEGELWLQRRWFPIALLGLWIAGTGTHLYCLGYIYDFDLRGELLAPAVWVSAWVLHQRGSDFIRLPGWERVAMFGPLLASFMAYTSAGSKVFVTLTFLNMAVYAYLFLGARKERLAFELLLLSAAALVSGVPAEWGHHFAAGFSRAKCVGAAMAVYLLLCALRSRDPRFGVVGGLICGVVTAVLLGELAGVSHWAIEMGLIFVLLHSLRWVDPKHQGAAALRFTAAAIWITHAVVWLHAGGAPWMLCALAAPVLGAYAVMALARRQWPPLVIPLSALLVLLSGPVRFTSDQVSKIPSGVLLAVGSFILFGLGTLTALTRHRWHRAE